MAKPFQELIDDLESASRAREAQEKLYSIAAARLLEPLRARIPQKVRSRLDAEDVLQEALLRAIRGISSASFESERQFFAWVYRIARNHMSDQTKRLSAQAMPFRRAGEESPGASAGTPRESQVPGRSKGPATELHSKEEIEVVLRKLGGTEADVIRRRWIEGQSFDEIAVALQKTRTAAKSLYSRAWKRFLELARRGRRAGPE